MFSLELSYWEKSQKSHFISSVLFELAESRKSFDLIGNYREVDAKKNLKHGVLTNVFINTSNKVRQNKLTNNTRDPKRVRLSTYVSPLACMGKWFARTMTASTS